MILKKGSLKKLPALLKVTFFNTLHTLPITVACMAVATLTANAIFHLSGNAINVSIIYILAILLHARYTNATVPVSSLLFTACSGSITLILTHI